MTNYIRTHTNRQFYFNDLKNNRFNIEDIAHALSNQCRWSGHTNKFYSVAEHSVHCSNLVEDGFQFEALMHDASEAYIVDIPRPLKNFVPDYRNLQRDLEQVLANYYMVPFPMSEEVRYVDDRMLVTEWGELFDKTDIYVGIDTKPFDINLPCWSPERAKAEFLFIAKQYI